MSDRDDDDVLKESIRRVKRGLWAQEGAPQEYQFEAFKADPFRRLKNLIEISFVTRHALAGRALDAGAGTGRFTFALEQRGVHTTALDLSPGMLREARQLAARTNTAFRATQGDVERLPFPDATFDNVVSITVLRHFPRWRDMLAELARVTRPGGRIIFDMASGDQRAFLRDIGAPMPSSLEDPQRYESAATERELEETANALGFSVIERIPNDFFDGNPLFDFIFETEQGRTNPFLGDLLRPTAALHLCETAAQLFMPFLPLTLSASWLAVLEKRSSASVSHSPSRFNANVETNSMDPLRSRLELALGPRYHSCMKELERCLDDPDAARLWAFLRNTLAPRIPATAWNGASDA